MFENLLLEIIIKRLFSFLEKNVFTPIWKKTKEFIGGLFNDKGCFYRIGEQILTTGIYTCTNCRNTEHNSAGNPFPPCAQCKGQVRFGMQEWKK